MSSADQNYISMPSSCTFDNSTSINIHVHDNRVYSPGAQAKVTGCHLGAGGVGSDGSASLNVSEWLKLGLDPGTSIEDVPSISQIMKMGMGVLTAH